MFLEFSLIIYSHISIVGLFEGKSAPLLVPHPVPAFLWGKESLWEKSSYWKETTLGSKELTEVVTKSSAKKRWEAVDLRSTTRRDHWDSWM